MVWPTSKISPEPSDGAKFAKTILSNFYDENGQTVSNLWTQSPAKREEILKGVYKDILRTDVIVKLANLNVRGVKRVIYSWRAIEDLLLVSTPELVNKPIHPLMWRIFRWCVSSCVHSYDHMHKTWKKFSLFLKHRALNTKVRRSNPFPRGLPGGVNGDFGPIWYDFMPWLKALLLVPFGRKPNHDFLKRFGTLCQTRNFPPPPLDERRFMKELRDWKSDLMRVHNLTQKQKLEARSAAVDICSYIKTLKFDRRTIRPHISLSGSACYRKTRNEGGRAVDFLEGWILDYVKTTQLTDVDTVTWFGAPYRLRKGYPKAYTMCRVHNLDSRLEEFLSSAFRNDMGSNTAMAAMFGGESSHISLEEPIFGLDPELPLQLFQYSIECMVRDGYIKGSPFSPAYYCRITDKRIRCRAHPVTEPGNKVRWVTMEDSHVCVFLQPFAHWMAGILRKYPSLYSAFNRSYKGWDVAVSLERVGKRQVGYAFGTYDLKGASNNLCRDFLREIGRAAIAMFERDPAIGSLLTLSLEVMLQDRIIDIYRDETERDLGMQIHCVNGILMGNPGTKEFLCFSSAVLHLIARKRAGLLEIPYNLIAGDDVFVYCTYRFFLDLIKVNQEFGNQIQWTKVLYSNIGIFFCEETLSFEEDTIGLGTSPWETEKHPKGYKPIKIEVIKLRLLSPFGLQSNLADSSYKNPAIGKSGAFGRVLDWFDNKQMAFVAARRFNRWMMPYLGGHPSCYLPRYLGGYGTKFLGTVEELLDLFSSHLDPRIMGMWSIMYHTTMDYHTVLDFVVRRMATGNTVRGLIDPLPYMISAQYSNLAINAWHDSCKNFGQLENELQAQKTYKVSAKDVRRYANKIGYMTYHDIVDSLDRLTLIRITMLVANGSLPLDSILPAKQGRLMNPQEVFLEFVEQEAPKFYKGSGFDTNSLNPTPETINDFRQWVRDGMQVPPVNRGFVFIPKSAITDSLSGMNIPFPYRPPKEVIKGSTEDHDVELITGYIAKLVSMNRKRRQ